MRVVFMGSPDFAIPSLRELAGGPHSVCSVFTQPDKPKGRGKKLEPTPVKKLADLLGIPVYQPQKLSASNVLERLKEMKPAVIVVVAYGKILPREVLEIPGLGCINVHASLLPKYRGAAPIHRAVINGEKYTGVTTMLMDTGMDTGDILLKKTVPVKDGDTAGVLHDRLAIEGARLLSQTLDGLEKGEIQVTPQNDEEATYAPPLTREDEIINWEQPAAQIRNQVRGLNPWPGARSTLEGKVLKIWEVELEKQEGRNSLPGTVLHTASKGGIVVQAGEGAVLVTRLQLQGKKSMTAADFLKGYTLPPGTVLGNV